MEQKRKGKGQFERGEYRKFWLTIFVTCVNAAIILTAMLQIEKTEIAFAAFTFAANAETLMLVYYYRTKTPAATPPTDPPKV